MNHFNRLRIRSQQGTSLVSLLVATLIMGFVAISIMGLMSLNTQESRSAYLRTDSLNAARVALDKMGRLMRMARCIGDVQGTIVPSTDPYAQVASGPSTDSWAVKNGTIPSGMIEDGTATNLSTTFPSLGDPYYHPPITTGSGKSAVTQTGTMVNQVQWPWGGSATTGYTLDGQTLIIQVPTFDDTGFPRAVQDGQTLSALDTYVYNLVQNNQAAGTWNLELAIFPAPLGKTNMPPGLGGGVPQVVLSNIIGPIDPVTNQPVVFQYVNSRDNSVTTAPIQNDLVLYSGVVCNLQILNRSTNSNRQAGQVTSLRSEMYLRNNSSCSIMGPTPPPPTTN